MSLAQTTETLATVTSGLASLVWWDFHGTQITPDDLRARVSIAGRDPSTVPNIDPTDAVRTATREYRKHEGKRVVMEAAIAFEDKTHIIVNLLTYTQQARDRVAKLPTDEMVWDKASQSWHSLGLTSEAAELRADASRLMTFMDGNAVRDYLVAPAMVDARSFTLKRGMHVVPHQTSAPVAAVAKALEGLETFKLRVAAVQPGQGWDAPLGDASRAELRNDLEELHQQIEGWKNMAKRVRSDTQEHVLARFQQIAERASLYREALSVSMEDIEAEIDAMRSLAEQVIEDKEAERAGATTRPAAPSAHDARRTALRNMSGSQLGVLWDALCGGDKPSDPDQLVEAIASAMEADAA